MSDPRVSSAISHWAPRFVSNGVNLADFQEVTHSITQWDQWCAAWSARALQHEDLGHAAMAQGFGLSAAEHWSRAAVYYHFAKFLFVEDLDQMRQAHAHAVRCSTLALPHLRPPAERVSIPFAGTTLKGLLRKPASATGPQAVVVMVPGLDSAKEELLAYEQPFSDRGLATLLVDGPGQGEAEYELPIRGDYEVAMHAVVDWIEQRSDLDAGRVGIWGVSLGGYYAPRAAAYEPRFKACVSLSGPFDWGLVWPQLPELTRTAFRVRSKLDTEAQALEHARSLSLAGAAERIRCPIFIVGGKQDRIVPWQDAQKLAQTVAGPAELLLIEDGGHNANNRPYRYRTQSADWMARQLLSGA
jgi:dipeptidyl aminopeptidase/acylaminoacyl peptidase